MAVGTITIQGQLAALNEHDSSNRGNKFGGAALKRTMTDMVAWQCKTSPKITHPCVITFHWFYSSRHDFDNIRFAAKYVLDGMVKAGVLPNDNQTWVLGFGGDFFIKVPKGNEKVEVEIEEYL
jgi:Holliday junction resolvase RusA-like endonuclease